MNVTFKGTPLALTGTMPAVGSPAPDATVVDNGMAPVKLSAFRGQVTVLLSVPSLDTPVCDVETRTFNEAAVKLSDAVRVALISMDLPFAQARWCGAAGVKRVQSLSDHRDAAFGTAYGLLIRDWRLLARAVLVLDRAGIVRYMELVPEIAQEPNYAAALDAVQKLI